jgi:propanol-preferring alcohol dehydrogenase
LFLFADAPDFVCGDWRIAPAPGVDCTGHEGAGYVAKVGPGVKGWKVSAIRLTSSTTAVAVADGGEQVGDRVGITPVAKTCGECEYCKGGCE